MINKVKKKAIFFDIDGTLFATGIGIPKSAINAIKKLKENGHLIFINSGRSKGNMDERFEALGFNGYVAGCGAYVEVDNKIIKNIILSKEDLSYASDILNRAIATIIYEGPDKLYYDKNDEIKIRKKFDRYPDVWPVDRFDLYDVNTAVVNKLCCELYTNSDVGLLRKSFDDYSMVIHANNEYVEIMPKNLSKSIGMKDVVEYYNISRDDTVAFGDSLNDLDMLKYAAIGVSMGNSCDELKQMSDFCTKSIYDDGIEYALKSLNLI